MFVDVYEGSSRVTLVAQRDAEILSREIVNNTIPAYSELPHGRFFTVFCRGYTLQHDRPREGSRRLHGGIVMEELLVL